MIDIRSACDVALEDLLDGYLAVFPGSSLVGSENTMEVGHLPRYEFESFGSSFLRRDMFVAANGDNEVSPKGSADKATSSDFDGFVFKKVDTTAFDLASSCFKREIDAAAVVVMISQDKDDWHMGFDITPKVSDAW